MTVNDVISYVDRVYHNDIDTEVKIDALERLDRQLLHDVRDTHERGDGVRDLPAPVRYRGDTELFAPESHAELYRRYLQAHLALILSQAGMYQTYAALYDAAYNEFIKEYNRTNTPLHRVRAFKLT